MKKKSGLHLIFQFIIRILFCSFLLFFSITLIAHLHHPLHTYEKTSVNPIKNQSIVIFGDSVSYGEKYLNTVSKYSYLPLAADYLGAKKVNNFSIPGSGIMANFEEGYTWQNIECAIKEHKEDVKKADIVIIAGGRNDTVVHNLKKYQLEINLTNQIKLIRKLNPEVTIYGIIPWDGLTVDPNRKISDYHIKKTKSGLTLTRVADILGEVYQKNDVLFFDPRKSTEEWKHTRVSDFGDGLTHPSDLMFRKMASAIINWFTMGNTLPIKEHIKVKGDSYLYQSPYDALVKDSRHAKKIKNETTMYCSNNIEYNGKYIVTVYESEDDYLKAKNPRYIETDRTNAVEVKAEKK